MEYAWTAQLIVPPSPSWSYLHRLILETRTVAFKAVVWKCSPSPFPLKFHGRTPGLWSEHTPVQECIFGVDERQVKISLYQFLAVWQLQWDDELNKNSVDVHSDFWHLLQFLLLLVLLLHCNSCSLFPSTTIINCTITWLTSQSHRSNCKINKMTSK